MLLGIEASANYEQASLQLETGDLLFLYTDGITDAQNPAGEFFGDRRVQQFVKSRCHLSAEEILDELLAAVQDFKAQAPSFDDITLLILKSL